MIHYFLVHYFTDSLFQKPSFYTEKEIYSSDPEDQVLTF